MKAEGKRPTRTVYITFVPGKYISIVEFRNFKALESVNNKISSIYSNVSLVVTVDNSYFSCCKSTLYKHVIKVSSLCINHKLK